jgi:hypothetical protein
MQLWVSKKLLFMQCKFYQGKTQGYRLELTYPAVAELALVAMGQVLMAVPITWEKCLRATEPWCMKVWSSAMALLYLLL